MVRMVQALPISRVTYVNPTLSTPKVTLTPFYRFIRRAFKLVLSLPMNISTARILQLGFHNTVLQHTEGQGHLSSECLRVPKGLRA